MPDWLNPWGALATARSDIERFLGVILSQCADIERLHRDVSFMKLERDNARDELAQIKERRSAAVSQGNRTKAAKRRLPFTTSNTGHLADQRTAITG